MSVILDMQELLRPLEASVEQLENAFPTMLDPFAAIGAISAQQKVVLASLQKLTLLLDNVAKNSSVISL